MGPPTFHLQLRVKVRSTKFAVLSVVVEPMVVVVAVAVVDGCDGLQAAGSWSSCLWRLAGPVAVAVVVVVPIVVVEEAFVATELLVGKHSLELLVVGVSPMFPGLVESLALQIAAAVGVAMAVAVVAAVVVGQAGTVVVVAMAIVHWAAASS